MTHARPVLQATITGRTATIVTPNGETEHLAGADGQDMRNVVVGRAYQVAVALGVPVEILTAGDQGEVHLVIDGRGLLEKVDFDVTPDPDQPLSVASQLPTTAPVRTPVRAGEPGPLRRPPAPPEVRAETVPDVDDELDRTVLVRRALTVVFDGADTPPIAGVAVVGRRGRAAPAGDTVTIDDHTGTISRQHARIETSAEEAWITDLGSVNGTTVSSGDISVQLAPGVPHPLQDGDRVQLGDVVLVARVGRNRRGGNA
ncbi:MULTISPECIES: FHA domain-containing protein [unclassified Microbacterium]|uniref:FHA domain-containing protein n=1 Tax=unclassified Microbacterium TaxID=2609290 RepID=UPI003016897F